MFLQKNWEIKINHFSSSLITNLGTCYFSYLYYIWNDNISFYFHCKISRLNTIYAKIKLFVLQKARPPNVRPPEYLILERRKKEDMLDNYRKNTQYMEFNDLKNEWERTTDRKIKLNTVKRKVDGLLLASQFTIEDRRERYGTIFCWICTIDYL